MPSQYRTTKFEATLVMSAIRKVYASYIITTACDYPRLRQDEHQVWQIIWDDGPPEWAVCFASACPVSVSDGKTYRVRDNVTNRYFPAPVGIPHGLFIEPQNNYTLNIYTA